MTPHSRDNPRFCEKQRPSKTRAQGRPGAGRTRSLVCSEGSTRVIHHRLDRNIRPSLRDGVNAYVRALPGVRDLIVTVISQVSCETWRQPRGARTTRFRRPRSCRSSRHTTRVHRIPPHVRDDAFAPLAEAGWRYDNHNFLKNGSKILFAKGLDRDSQKSLVGQISCEKALFCKAFLP
jgi:hypothetical protein